MLVFPTKLQFNYEQKALVCEIDQLEFLNDEKLGNHEEVDLVYD